MNAQPGLRFPGLLLPVSDEATAEATDSDMTEQDAQVEAEAETAAETDAEALAEVEAEAEAEVEVEAEALQEAETQADADAEAEAEVQAMQEADAEAEAAQETAEEPEAEAAAGDDGMVSDECVVEVVDSDGSIICSDVVTEGSVAAIAAEADAETEAPAEVTSETVTEEALRSSDEEFREWSPDDQDGDQLGATTDSATTSARPRKGLSDLERAGLLALGAVAVGAILSNGQRVESNTGDRIIAIDDDGTYRVLKDDDALLRQPGSDIRTERYADGSTRTEMTRDDGTRIVTIRDSDGRALRRVRIEPDGREYLLIDDTRVFEPVVVRDLPRPAHEGFDFQAATDRETLRLALLEADRRDIGRSFSLRQVREYVEVRELAPEINLRGITFVTNSAGIERSQAEQLRDMGLLMGDLIREDPAELFLIEGHTDAVGDAGSNLLLSDRRAESVALAFSEYFDVRPENMLVQGYGERFLKIRTQQAERLNRRVTVRRITPLVRQYGG